MLLHGEYTSISLFPSGRARAGLNKSEAQIFQWENVENQLANKSLDNLSFENLNLFSNSCLGFRIFKAFAYSNLWQDTHRAGPILAVTLTG